MFVKENRYTCADPGQAEIRKAIKEQNLNRVVIAACSPRMHEPTFRRTVSEAGLNPFLYEMANIREFASWCHQSDPKAATERAKDSVRMAVAKVRLMQPLQTHRSSSNKQGANYRRWNRRYERGLRPCRNGLQSLHA